MLSSSEFRRVRSMVGEYSFSGDLALESGTIVTFMLPLRSGLLGIWSVRRTPVSPMVRRFIIRPESYWEKDPSFRREYIYAPLHITIRIRPFPSSNHRFGLAGKRGSAPDQLSC